MEKFIKECERTVSLVHGLLEKQNEWESRYEKYADAIYENSELIKGYKKMFHQWNPLYLYLNISNAKKNLKSNVSFSLRYLGQDVATLKINNDNKSKEVKVTISTKSFDVKNKRDFDCIEKLDGVLWKSKEAARFRKHFSTNPERTKITGKGNTEHRIESLLLTEFSEKAGNKKTLRNIQPVKIAGIARFQMPTPLSASNIKNDTKYSKNGGGIDILARFGKGKVRLCIMEVKDENKKQEPPRKAIIQALSYATFISKLLKSPGGEKWWKIFGFNGKVLSHLELIVACAMPSIENNDVSFQNKTIQVNNDSFNLQYIYFKEKDNKILEIETSLVKKVK